MTPFQDIPLCANTLKEIPFENPLYGNSSTTQVTLHVDEEAPIVTCGFRDVDPINDVVNKTLYHYLDEDEVNGKRMKDAKFFYKIEVRVC